MKTLSLLVQNIRKNPSAWLFLVIAIFTIDRYNRWVDFEKDASPFVYDVNEYYSYLPAAFIHHDLSFNYPGSTALPAGNGNRIPKVTMGMAIMYSPFFFAGHAIAKATNAPLTGFSLPYKWCVHFGSILYALLGLWFCRKNLLLFFPEIISTIALVCVFFGTNLFYYTYGFGEMSHSYLFFIDAAFVFFTIMWVRSQKFSQLLWLSFLGGFATLIRPTECLLFIFPLLFGVTKLSDIKSRFMLLLSYRYKIFFAICLVIFPFFLQMMFWKIHSGHWLFFSYGDERFFFNDPQVINFLFSFRKGWLLYTPMMAFGIAGIFFMRKHIPEMFYFLIIFLALDIYILSSWWAWSYGGSFGCRALIQHYCIMIFPLAAFIQFIFGLFSSKYLLNLFAKTALLFVFYLVIILNFNQSWLYKYAIIPSDNMTKEAYLYIMRHDTLGPEQVKELYSLTKTVPAEEMKKGNRD
jgi:hypothetical protein